MRNSAATTDMSRRRTAPPTDPEIPLDKALRQAVERAPDGPTREWLAALLEHGESAGGGPAAPDPAA